MVATHGVFKVFQSFYNLLPCLVGPLICHTTNFSPSPRDTSEVFHIEAGKGSIFTSKTFGPCQGKLFPPREGVGWTCRLLNSHHFFGASDFFLIKKKRCLLPLFELPTGKEGSSHLPSTRSFNQPKKYDMTKLGGFQKIKEDNDNMKPFSQGKYPSNIHGCKALRCLSHQLRASTQTCNPSATCQTTLDGSEIRLTA